MKIKILNLLELLITVSLILGLILTDRIIYVLSLWMVIEVLLNLCRTKENITSILLLFIFIYSITPFAYFNLGISICPYQQYDTEQYYNMIEVTKIQSLFQSIFMVWLNVNTRIRVVLLKEKIKNEGAYYFSLLVMLCCFGMIDLRGMLSSLTQNGYTTQRTGSILFDYFVIFSLINYRYSVTSKQKLNNLIFTIIVAVTSLFSGTRMSAIMLLLLIFILHFENRISKKMTITLGFLGIFLMNAFQYIRQFDIPTIKQILLGDYNVETNMLRSNAGDVWYASEAIYKLIHVNIFDIKFRIKSFIGSFLNMFLTTSLTPKEALVNLYIIEHKLIPYPNNGGLIGITTYLWFGYAGTIILAMLLSKIIAQVISKGKSGGDVSILVFVTFPKWYAYNPRILFKFVFVGLVYIGIYKIFFRRKVNIF